MTWTTVFIYGLNSMRLSLKMQSCTRSITNYPTKYTEIGNIDNQSFRPTKDIPGPKGLPLIGNLFRYMPYTGESSFIYA